MSLRTDLRHGLRLLVRDRGVSAAAICALGLALAAASTLFTVVNAIFLKPLPFDDPERVVLLRTERQLGGDLIPAGLSYLELEEWRAGTRTLTGIAAFVEDTMNLADDRVAPEQFQGAIVSANAFGLIGDQPIAGRAFIPADDAPGAPPVVMLGYGVWQSRYGGTPDVVGRLVRVNGRQATVVGVMPDGFRFPQSADIWQPLSALPERQRGTRTDRGLTAIGRMRPGVTREQAAADVGGVAAALAARYPDAQAGVRPRVGDFRDRSVGRVRVVFTAFGLAAGFVLLIACANVANLLLARGLDRGREMSIRLSMGASRGRLAGQVLVESALLGLAAGAAGLVVSLAGVAAFTGALRAAGDVPYFLDFSVDWRVYAFLTAISLLASMIFGLVPALQTSRVALTAVLADGGRAATAGPRSRAWHGALVAVQVGLAIVLVTAAGLALRDLRAQARVDVGIDSAGVTTARFLLPEGRYATPEARAAFYRQLDGRLASLPAGRAAIATYPPFNGAEVRAVGVDGGALVQPRQRRISYFTVGPRYFATLATGPVRGREFRDADADGVALVNERFAALYFPGVDALGHQLTVASPRRDGTAERLTVVGVVPNVRQRPAADRDFDPIVYVPQAAPAFPFAAIVVRSDAGTAAVAGALRSTVSALDADLPLYDISSLQGLLEADRWEGRMVSTMFGLFAALALTLAAVGVYAVAAFAVSRRTREIGVRMALGARGSHIALLVTRGAALSIGLGTALGVAGSLAAGGILDAILQEIDAADAVTLAGAPLLLALVTVAACLVPAARLAAAGPAHALRAE